MLSSVFALQTFEKFGADSVSQSAIPYQNAGWSWKLKVPPVPSCVGRCGGSFGSRSLYTIEFPEPGTFE